MAHICSACGEAFGKKSEHNAHWKKCVNNVTFTAYNGESITVIRNEGGSFLCYCSHPGCPNEKGYVTTDGLKRHLKQQKSTWLGPEKKVSMMQSTTFFIFIFIYSIEENI